MARPLSDEKRTAILQAAIRIIAQQGTGAPTAGIAKEAGVSNGALFTYFETKADLFNQLFCELKRDMVRSALGDASDHGTHRDRMHHMWVNWLRWSIDSPAKRRTLARLEISEEVNSESRALAREIMSPIVTLIEASRTGGPMEGVPLALVVALMSGLADTTIDFILIDPSNAPKHIDIAFDALWRIIA